MSKKLICLLLSVMMLLSCITPALGATFTDVPKTNDYYEAIDMLSEFGIILGDAGAGTFRPDAEISREEFSVIVTRILGVSNIVPSMDVLPFTDVTPVSCADWAIIATKVAYDLKIISGYGDGRFGPKDPVTYEQVVKMLVCALGYGPAAEERGGWPHGYINVANDLGITKNAVMLQTGNAPRGIVAQLVYNCLDVELMESVGGGQSQIKYGHTLLSDKLGYKYAEGIVTGVPGLAYNMDGKVIHEGEVEIDGKTIYSAGKTNAKDYFGHSGEFYYKKKGTTATIVYFRSYEDNVVFEFTPERIISVDENKLTYYVDEDENEIEAMSIKGATYIYNGEAKDLAEITKPNIGTMKVIDNDNDEIADLVILNDTRIIVVNSVDAVKKIIVNKYDTNERIVLDGESKEVEFLKDGKEATFSSIVRDSVLMVTENDEKITVDVITKSVSGTITSEEENGEILGIGNKSYEIMPDYAKYISENPDEKITIGDSVTFYITSDNRILYGKIKTVTMKVGYLIHAAADEEEEITKARILNTSGKIEVKEFAEKTYVNGARKKYDEIVDALSETTELTNKDDGAKNTTVSQLIKYTESSGKINNVYTMKESGDKTRDLIIDVPYTDDKHTYSTTTKKLGESNISLDSKTKIFRVPTSRSDLSDYAVKTGVNGLSNSTKYRFEAYDVSDTGVAGYIIVYGLTTSPSWGSVAVISSISTKVNKENETVNEVTLITNGSSSKKETENLKVLEGFSVGDVIRYAQKDGAIVEAKKIYSPASESHKIIEVVTTGTYKTTDYYYGYGSSKTGVDVLNTNVIVGTVYGRDDTRLVISEGEVDENGVLSEEAKRHNFDFNDSVVYYLYDVTKDKPFITTDITKEFLSTYLDAGKDASKVVIYNNSYTTMKFIYIINN